MIRSIREVNFVLQTTGIWNEIFEWTNPHPFLNGEYFEVFVENRYGFTTGLSEIEVSKKEGESQSMHVMCFRMSH